MNKILLLVIVTLMFMSTIHLVESSNHASLSHNYEPWHKMFFDSDSIGINIHVKNNSDKQKQFAVKLELISITNTQESDERIFGYNLGSGEKDTVEFTTRDLSAGQWKLRLQLYENSVDGIQVEGYETVIFVQPIQNFYSLLGAVGAILAGSGAIVAVITQFIFNKSTLKQSKIERRATLEEMKKQTASSERISKIGYEPFISPRTILLPQVGTRVGFSNIGNGSAKNIHLDMMDAETGVELEPFDMFAMRANENDDRATNVDTTKHPWVIINGTYQNIENETKTIDIVYNAGNRITIDLE